LAELTYGADMTIQTAIQLPEEAYERLRSLAEAKGQSPTDFMSKAILEYLEDIEDVMRAEEIMRKIEAGESRTYTLEEVERRLGLDD
jgi:RHH-type rel operon transcriptional repressor/antitoxin RelB